MTASLDGRAADRLLYCPRHALSFIVVSPSCRSLVDGAVRVAAASRRVGRRRQRRRVLRFAEPGISPDGREIAFTSGGDIWSVPAAGGDARLLVADAGHRSAAAVLARRPSARVRLDAHRRRRHLRADARDRRAAAADVGRRARAAGRLVARRPLDLLQLDEPRHRGHERHLSRAGRRRHADAGDRGALRQRVRRRAVARRPAARVRRARHRVESVVAQGQQPHRSVRALADESRRRRPTTRRSRRAASRQVWPMWSGDGRSLFYVSDRGGAENIWTRPAVGRRAPIDALTTFKDGRVLWPSITADGAHDRVRARLRHLDARHGSGPGARRCRSRGAARRRVAAPERVRQTTQFSDLALSPDGRKVAFIARGDVFAASAKDGGDATRVTATPRSNRSRCGRPTAGGSPTSRRRGAGQQHLSARFRDRARRRRSRPAPRPISRRCSRRTASSSRFCAIARSCACSISRRAPIACWPPASSPTRSTRRSRSGRPTAVDCAVRDRRQGVHERRARAGRRRRRCGRSAFSRTCSRTRSPGVRDGTYLLFDTRQRTEDGQLARVDLHAAHAEDSARISSAICSASRRSRRNPDTREPPPAAGARPGHAGTPEPRNRRSPIFADIRQRLSLLPVGLDVGGVDDQSRRQDGRGRRDDGGPDEPLFLLARRAGDRAARRAAADDDRGRESRSAVHAGRQGGLLSRRRPHSDRERRAARSARRSP